MTATKPNENTYVIVVTLSDVTKQAAEGIAADIMHSVIPEYEVGDVMILTSHTKSVEFTA